MIHLLAMVLLVVTLCFVVVLMCRVIWLCVLLVAFCVITAMLAVIVGCQKLSQVFDEWQWRRRYGEILPPDWPGLIDGNYKL